MQEKMATHSGILAWETPWTEEPGGLYSMGLQRVRYDHHYQELRKGYLLSYMRTIHKVFEEKHTYHIRKQTT